MKNRSIIFAASIIFVAIVLILGTTYFVADGKLYYYGKSRYNIFKHSLPLGMKPDYWGADVCFPAVGFTIEDRGGIVMIGKGESYLFEGDTIKIDRIIKYGIGQHKLITFIEDTNSRNYYIECQKNTDPQSKRELEINVLNNSYKIGDDYKWVNLAADESKISELAMIRVYTVFSFIVLIVVIPGAIFIIRNKK